MDKPTETEKKEKKDWHIRRLRRFFSVQPELYSLVLVIAPIQLPEPAEFALKKRHAYVRTYLNIEVKILATLCTF